MAQHQKEFKLEKDFIELDNLLKVTNFAASGAEAKQMIRAGLVKVNGTIENKVRRKLCPKDVVDFAENKILIT
jgi:ribosome-associated protein